MGLRRRGFFSASTLMAPREISGNPPIPEPINYASAPRIFVRKTAPNLNPQLLVQQQKVHR